MVRELSSDRSVWARRTLGDIVGPAFFVVLGCLICQLGLGFGYAVNPLAGDIISEFGWDRARFSEAHSWQIWMIAIASPGVGLLASRFGAKRILVASTLMLGLIFFLYSEIANIWHLRGIVLLFGLCLVGLGDITVGHIVMQWVKRGRGLALGIVFTGSNLGGFILVPIVVALAERESWRAALFQLGWIALVVLLPAALLLVREKQDESEAQGAPDFDNTPTHRESVTDLDLTGALRTRSFWVLAISLFVFFAYFLSMLQHLVLYWTDIGMERTQAADYYRNALGLGIVSKVVLGAIADRIPHRTALLVDFGLLAGSSALLLVMPGGTLVMWAFVAMFGFGSAARDVVYPLIIGDCFGVSNLAAIYGALMFAILPAGVLGPVFTGAMYDQTGSYLPAFATFAVCNVLAVAGLTMVRDER